MLKCDEVVDWIQFNLGISKGLDSLRTHQVSGKTLLGMPLNEVAELVPMKIALDIYDALGRIVEESIGQFQQCELNRGVAEYDSCPLLKKLIESDIIVGETATKSIEKAFGEDLDEKIFNGLSELAKVNGNHNLTKEDFVVLMVFINKANYINSLLSVGNEASMNRLRGFILNLLVALEKLPQCKCSVQVPFSGAGNINFLDLTYATLINIT